MWPGGCVFNISAGDTGQCNKTRKHKRVVQVQQRQKDSQTIWDYSFQMNERWKCEKENFKNNVLIIPFLLQGKA